jgi:hypothetical protein
MRIKLDENLPEDWRPCFVRQSTGWQRRSRRTWAEGKTQLLRQPTFRLHPHGTATVLRHIWSLKGGFRLHSSSSRVVGSRMGYDQVFKERSSHYTSCGSI